MAVKKPAIGSFDSGLGGLTVLSAIQKQIPQENLIYVGDTARVPYGTKSKETVTRYALQITEFLVGQGVKALVVACNTASAFALAELESKFDIPIIGVLQPGARAAVATTKRKRVGVIGTEGTIRSGAYRQAILELEPQVHLYMKACPLFVPLVEEGWVQHPVTELVAKTYLEDFIKNDIDCLILGCTHYPLLKPILKDVLGVGVYLVDSAQETANELVNLLKAKNLQSESGKGKLEFYSTDAPDKFQALAGRFLAQAVESVHLLEI